MELDTLSSSAVHCLGSVYQPGQGVTEVCPLRVEEKYNGSFGENSPFSWNSSPLFSPVQSKFGAECNTPTHVRVHRRLSHSAPSKSHWRKIVSFSDNLTVFPPVDTMETMQRSKTEYTLIKKSSKTEAQPRRKSHHVTCDAPYPVSDERNGYLQSQANHGLQKEKTLSVLITQRKTPTWISRSPTDACAEIVRERLKDNRQKRKSTERKKESAFLTRLRKSISAETDDVDTREQGLAYNRFRRVARGIQMLVRWLNAIIYISDEKTTRTATEEQWYTLYTSQEARKLAFSKSLFARERAFARVPVWAIKIFDSAPEDRPEVDCRRIHALLRGLKSFDKFTERIQLYMCRSFRYQSVEPGRVILRRGHVGFNFYFIYSGSVFVNIQDINIEGRRFEKTETVLARGDSFGELALLQDIRRTATITCREKCELLVVDKETFAKVCPSIFDEELEEKEKFLSRLPLFNPKYWSREKLKMLCTEAHIQEYKTNKVVATDDDDEEWLYICMEGKCQVIRRIALDEKNLNTKPESGKRASTPELSDDILDILKNVDKSENTEGMNDVDDFGDDSEDEQGKERMLESMSLEYRKDGREYSFLNQLKSQRRKIMKNQDKEDVVKKKDMSLRGPMSLTSLMTHDKENSEGQDFMYLDIATVQPDKVFDLYSILYPGYRPSNSAKILVSLGARLLRFKKKIYFGVISSDAMVHAKILSKKDRYPSDEQILSSYREKYEWEIFKNNILKNVLQPHLNSSRFTHISNAQKHTDKDYQQRTSKLLKVLKNNTHREKSRNDQDVQELKRLRDQTNMEEEQSVSAEAIIMQSLSKQKAKTSKIIHNFVIGRGHTYYPQVGET